MKLTRYLVVLIAALLLSSSALGLTSIGPPASNIGKGQFALGFDYTHSEYDLEWKGDTSVLFPEFDLQFNQYDVEVETKNQKTDAYLAKISYGLAEGSELFVRLGTAESDFAWGVGAKTTLAKSPKLDWGLAIQASWLRFEETETVGPFYIEDIVFGPFIVDGEMDVTAIQIVTGPVLKLDKLHLYGGPFLSWLKADSDFKATGNFTVDIPEVGSVSTPVIWTGSFDVENDFQLGGYIGLSLEIIENLNLNAEYQMTKDSQVMRFGMMYRF